MTRIGVNVRLLIRNRIDGIARFSYESLKRMVMAHPEVEFVFFFDRSYASEFIFGSNVIPVVVPPQTRRPWLNTIWTRYTLPMALKKYPVDLFLSMDGMLPLSAEMPCLPVIHDLNFEHYPEWLPATAARHYRHTYPQYAQKARRIATVSEYSRNDIARTYGIPPDRIDVVYNGVSGNFHRASETEVALTRKELTGGQPYFLFVGSVHPRKNLINTLKAYEHYRLNDGESYPLLIVGEKYFGNSGLDQLYQSMAYRNDIHFTGAVDDAKLIRIYGAAHTFIYPTLFEGFGIPALEAMQSQIPVIASNTTALPEVCGEAALYVNPLSVEAIAAAMREADHVKIREKLINLGIRQAAGFTWDRTAHLLWNSIEQTISTNHIL